jgi:hypothetical protein
MVGTLVIIKLKVATASTVKDGGEIFERRMDGMYESVKKY